MVGDGGPCFLERQEQPTLGKAHAVAVYGLATPAAFSHSLPQALIAAGSGPVQGNRLRAF